MARLIESIPAVKRYADRKRVQAFVVALALAWVAAQAWGRR